MNVNSITCASRTMNRFTNDWCHTDCNYITNEKRISTKTNYLLQRYDYGEHSTKIYCEVS